MADDRARGRFVWYDLMTSDPRKAEAFYTKLAGWGTMPWDGPMPYTMWTVGGAPIGGVMTLPSGAPAPPHWVGYVSVPDVDATVSQTESLGGRTIAKAADIPTVGRYAVLADPQGAVFAVFAASGQTPGHEGVPAVGEFSWHELMTTAYSSAFRFYQSLFGWEKLAEHDMGPMGVYLIFGRNGTEMGGMFNKSDDMPMPPNWLQYIRVDSADRVVDVVKGNGGTIMNGPMDVPGGDRIAQCMDPQGAAFAIHSRKV
jgi:predicted enzyme related to lactoylglutathione lyase